MRHALEYHGLTPTDFCKEVHGRTLAEGLQPVTPQVARSALADWKADLSDANLQQGVCACCARAKRKCKLTDAIFPSRDAPTPPEWLGWSLERWQQHGSAWHDQVHALLDVSDVKKMIHTSQLFSMIVCGFVFPRQSRLVAMFFLLVMEYLMSLMWKRICRSITKLMNVYARRKSNWQLRKREAMWLAFD